MDEWMDEHPEHCGHGHLLLLYSHDIFSNQFGENCVIAVVLEFLSYNKTRKLILSIRNLFNFGL